MLLASVPSSPKPTFVDFWPKFLKFKIWAEILFHQNNAEAADVDVSAVEIQVK